MIHVILTCPQSNKLTHELTHKTMIYRSTSQTNILWKYCFSMFLYRITIYLCSCILWNVQCINIKIIFHSRSTHRPQASLWTGGTPWCWWWRERPPSPCCMCPGDTTSPYQRAGNLWAIKHWLWCGKEYLFCFRSKQRLTMCSLLGIR